MCYQFRLEQTYDVIMARVRGEGRHAGTKGYSWIDVAAVLVLALGLNLMLWGSLPTPGWILVIVGVIRVGGVVAYRRFDGARRTRRN
jgi:hypothetical protein